MSCRHSGQKEDLAALQQAISRRHNNTQYALTTSRITQDAKQAPFPDTQPGISTIETAAAITHGTGRI